MESEPMPRQAASKVDTQNLSPPERKGKCKAIKWQIQETSSETEHSKSAAGHAKGLVLYSSVGMKQGSGIFRMCFRDDSDALLRI